MPYDKQTIFGAPPDSWRDLVIFLREARTALLPSWRYEAKAGASFEENQMLWEAFELPRRKKIDDLMARWIDGAQVALPSEEDAYLFCVRLIAISEVLEFLSYFKSGAWVSPFPYPKAEKKSLMKELLIDWWAGAGSHLALERLSK